MMALTAQHGYEGRAHEAWKDFHSPSSKNGSQAANENG